MSELERSLTNIDWLVSCSPAAKQPIKSDPAGKQHFCGKCIVCSRVRSRRKTAVPFSDPTVPSGDVTNSKPTHSYAHIITEAILSSTGQRLTLSEVYKQIISRYPYFKTAASGWKNSVRHNLSLSKIFKKVARPEGESGKGSYWEVDKEALQEVKNDTRYPKRRRSSLPADEPEGVATSPHCGRYIPFYPPYCPTVPYSQHVFPLPLPPHEMAQFLPDTRCQLNESCQTFYRSMLEAQRQGVEVSDEPAAKRQKVSHPESAFDTSLSVLRLKMDSLARGTDDLSDLDVSTFEQLVASLNPADKQKEQLYSELKESFSHFLRELTASGTKSRQLELSQLHKHFSTEQEFSSSNEPSSQEFDWNAIL